MLFKWKQSCKFFVMEMVHKQGDSVLLLRVVTVECGSKKYEAV